MRLFSFNHQSDWLLLILYRQSTHTLLSLLPDRTQLRSIPSALVWLLASRCLEYHSTSPTYRSQVWLLVYSIIIFGLCEPLDVLAQEYVPLSYFLHSLPFMFFLRGHRGNASLCKIPPSPISPHHPRSIASGISY